MEGIEKKRTIAKQMDFYKEGLAGCKFAEYAARNPEYHKWSHVLFEKIDIQRIDDEVLNAVRSENTNQLSLIFPNIDSKDGLEELISSLKNSEVFYTEPEEEFNSYRLIKLRAHILGKSAWVSGFGPLDFLPQTRQSPYTELVLRVKDKPAYSDNIQKPTNENEIHIADLEVPLLSKIEFVQMLGESFRGTRNVLGHKADELSAAKVTFTIPK